MATVKVASVCAGSKLAALLDQHAAEGLQRLAQRLDQALRAAASASACAVADEQRIVEHLAQPRQRVADRRLREVEPPAARLTPPSA